MNHCQKYRRKKKSHHKLFVWMFIIFLILVLLVWYIFAVVNPVIVQTAEAKIKNVTQRTLSSAVMAVVKDYQSDLDNLVSYSYTDNNRVSLINVSSYLANLVARQISSGAQTSLDNITSTGIDLHLGAFTGMAFLASVGPLVHVNLTPIGTVMVKFRSEFLSVGINQTHHKIYIRAAASVYLVLPTANPQFDLSTELLVNEAIIVGEIPDTYLQSSYLDEMLNLVPV